MVLATLMLTRPSALAADLNSIPEVADFHGVNDPPDPSRDAWSRRLDNSLDEMVDETKNYPGLTTDLYVPGESEVEHTLGLFPEGAGKLTGDTVTDMGEILKGRTLPEHVRDTNPFAALTAQSSDRLRKSILAAPQGSLSPADVMKISLDVTNGNYPLATLTAHDVLKSTAENGRRIRDQMADLARKHDEGKISQAEYDRRIAELRKSLKPYSDITSRLENMRGRFPGAGQNDKIGPWYHAWGILAAGAIHGPTDAMVGQIVENLGKKRGYQKEKKAGTEAPYNPEKGEIDSRVAWRVFDPTQLGTLQRDHDIEGPHPSVFIPDFTGRKSWAKCQSAKKRIDSVINQMKGSVSPSVVSAGRSDIARVKSQIPDCPGLGAKVAKAESAVTAAAKAEIQDARSATKSCDSEYIRKKALDLSHLADYGSSEVANELIEAAQAVDRANDEAETSIGLYEAHRDAGNLGLARKALLEAKAALAPMKASGCFAGEQARIDTLIAQIDEREKTICAELTAKMDEANAHYRRKGGLIDAKNAVDSVQEKLDKLDPSICPAVRTRVSTAQERIKNIDRVIKAVGKDLNVCDPVALTRWSEKLSNINQPELIALRERAKASIAVAENYQRARDVYADDPAKAKGYFEAAARLAREAGQKTCTNIVDRIDNNLTRVSTAEKLDKWVTGVAKTCDFRRIKSARNKLAGQAKLRFQFKMIDRLDTAALDCEVASEAKKKQEAADREAVCRRDHGPGYSVGHILEDGRFFCMPDQATANAWCVKDSGSGYIAVNIDSRGGFSCEMTKEAANAWCKEHNGGGWYAGNRNKDGTYTCVPGKSVRNADCRRKYGSGWYAGSLRRDGSYLCHGPRQARPRGSQPRGPSGAEIGNAIGEAIIQGIIQSQGARGTGSGGRRCHRNPNTGQVHCGSN